MSQWREEVIGDCRLILGDCREGYEGFDRRWAVVSDVPYGMGWDTNTMRFSGGDITSSRKRGKGKISPSIVGDNMPFNPTPWLDFHEVILWGANHFSQRLPRGTTLVWIKRFAPAFGTFLSDAELAWQKGGYGVYCHQDLSMTAEATSRLHPCQKPVGLMAWCIARCKAATILDPYMGSASTALAALKLGRRFVGCELDPRYFDLACRRIEAAYRQPDLFIEHAKRQAPTQPALFTTEAPR